ncbi:MAG TPA: cobaltochelatase subunit CobN [Polyangiaceae bacterium]|nr:cobaltochelatase subunit CobN [Polyangiaceae bacterium]
MHVLATRPGGYAAGDGVVDLRQTPADVVILSAADTDLLSLAAAMEALPADYPTLRLASLLALRSNASVDLYFDSVLVHARVVIVALMGGTGYWPYGVDRLVERARDGLLQLLLVPGDDTVDPELERLSSVAATDGHAIWRYLREGGRDNARALLELVAQRFFERPVVAEPPRELPRVAVYHPGRGAVSLAFWEQQQRGTRAPVAALLFYRAHLQAQNLRAFDALIATLAGRGLAPLPVALASLKDSECRAEVEALLRAARAELVLNTTGFAIANLDDPSGTTGALGLGRPVLQVMVSGGNVDDWRAGAFGLAPRDLAMNVVLPEIDGRIITRAVSFKGLARRSARTELDVAEYQLEPERADFVAELAAAWIELARTPAAERRVALVLANYPARDGRIGNGVGLDTPASALEILRALAASGYPVAGLPREPVELLRWLGAGVTNELAPIDTRPARVSLPLEEYAAFFAGLPLDLQRAVNERWGAVEDDPRHRDGHLVVSGLELGGTFVGVQPARGYEVDVAATYHDPALVPPHGYLAFYAWLRRVYRAQAIVHVGKHGNLEWLPGKSVALGPSCWPDAIFGPMPHLYPFIVNDPGEGTQAKRRAQAVIVDHLVPPLTRAESYGALRDLERLVDEYYQASMLDAPRALLLRRDILKLARELNLTRELGAAPRAAPGAAKSGDDEQTLVAIDAYLCELKESQIRDGLHVFGRSPQGAQRIDTLVALARLPARRGDGRDQSLIVALARALLEDGAQPPFDPLDLDPAAPWAGPKPALLAELTSDPWRTAGDTRERLELLARAIVAGERAAPPACRSVVERIERELGPALDCCGERELSGLLACLDGRFVPPGPSGAPTRGRLDVLPTGRNFYSVDVRAVPTPAAVELARRSADRLVQRHVQAHGEYPRCIALSVWGTATMRTGGDDVAQALALLGVRPVWADGSGRVIDTEILPLSVLRRPRVDVVLRISGFFRDAFPDLIRLFDSALRSVAELDESSEQNPVRARVRADEAALLAAGVAAGDAARRARYRVFGSRPGAYGAGLQSLLDSGRWSNRRELADVYLDWSGYAYGSEPVAVPARDSLESRLSQVDVVLHNQDNREHDVLDSSDYYEFQGGLAAAVERVRGRPAALYHGDHSNPAAPRVRPLGEEIARVLRSRVVNPKWIAAARRHGYKGAAEMAATAEYLFGYAATTALVHDYQFAMLTDAYLLDAENRRFLGEFNPSALREITERLLEAMQRGLWREPGAYRDRLESLLLDVEEGVG